MKQVAFFIMMAFSLGPSTARSQDDFTALKVKLGQTVYVTTGGTTIRGTVNELSSTALRVGTHEFRPGPDLKIERAGVPMWHGILIGAGIAALSAALIYPHSKDRTDTALVAGLIGGAWGAWFTHAVWGRTVIYSSAPNQNDVINSPLPRKQGPLNSASQADPNNGPPIARRHRRGLPGCLRHLSPSDEKTPCAAELK
jgi:hypothetical protein